MGRDKQMICTSNDGSTRDQARGIININRNANRKKNVTPRRPYRSSVKDESRGYIKATSDRRHILSYQ